MDFSSPQSTSTNTSQARNLFLEPQKRLFSKDQPSRSKMDIEEDLEEFSKEDISQSIRCLPSSNRKKFLRSKPLKEESCPTSQKDADGQSSKKSQSDLQSQSQPGSSLSPFYCFSKSLKSFRSTGPQTSIKLLQVPKLRGDPQGFKNSHCLLKYSENPSGRLPPKRLRVSSSSQPDLLLKDSLEAETDSFENEINEFETFSRPLNDTEENIQPSQEAHDTDIIDVSSSESLSRLNQVPIDSKTSHKVLSTTSKDPSSLLISLRQKTTSGQAPIKKFKKIDTIVDYEDIILQDQDFLEYYTTKMIESDDMEQNSNFKSISDQPKKLESLVRISVKTKSPRKQIRLNK